MNGITRKTETSNLNSLAWVAVEGYGGNVQSVGMNGTLLYAIGILDEAVPNALLKKEPYQKEKNQNRKTCFYKSKSFYVFPTIFIDLS